MNTDSVLQKKFGKQICLLQSRANSARSFGFLVSDSEKFSLSADRFRLNFHHCSTARLQVKRNACMVDEFLLVDSVCELRASSTRALYQNVAARNSGEQFDVDPMDPSLSMTDQPVDQPMHQSECLAFKALFSALHRGNGYRPF